MIKRNKAPEIKGIATFDYLMPEEWVLSNGIKVWGINAGSQELVKIDMIFDAGTWYQSENLVAGLANAFMNQGSKHYSAQQIAEAFDFRGAYLQLSADQQFGNVTVLTLNKYLDEILRVTADVIMHPVFPEKEVSAQVNKKKQQFIVENNKVKTMAQKRFSQVLFGEDHPYANTNKIEDFDHINSHVLQSFHRKHYCASNCRIIVAGRYGAEEKKAVERYLGGDNWTLGEPVYNHHFELAPASEKQHLLIKGDALQSAVRIGCLLPKREHHDFHGLTILSTLLGGYFGSRLMTELREEKGYTYGIGSYILTLPNAAYLSISSEVGVEVTAPALQSIYQVIQRLQQEAVEKEELEVVKNYLLGENLRSFDGVFAMSASLRTLLEAGLWYDHYEQLISEIQLITPERIQQLAVQYLQHEDMYEVVAGKM